MKIFIVGFLLCLVLTGGAIAQFNFFDNSRSIEQPRLLLDYASFKSPDSGKVRFEIYYQVFNFTFEFQKQNIDYVAEYELMVTVNDDNGMLAASEMKDKRIVVPDEEKARSRTDFRTSQINFDLLPGKYEVKFSIRDKFSENTYTTDFKMKLKEFDGEEPRLSDIEFIRTVDALKEEAGVFDKGNILVVPSVARSYGGDDDARLLYYFEVYRGNDSTAKVDVETKIRKKNGMMIYRDTLNDILSGPMELQLRDILVEDYSPGEYELEIFLRGRRNKKLDEKKEKFTIQWSLRGLLKHDFKTAIDQLSIVAQPGEVDKMKNIESQEERLNAFNEFWKALDPTPGTAKNERQIEFYRRVNFANVHFKTMRREGWQTDRGRVFIKYGEPDEIDDVPMSLTFPPYQVWNYYKIGAYRKFTFVDENEDGEYRLQYPYDGLDQSPDF